MIIPTRNRAALLKEALDSVYAQKGAEELFELDVIVADDASTDSTPDVASRYPITQYLRLPTSKGPAAARNAGIVASRGAYLAFLDDDDLWLPDKLSLQVPALEANPNVCVAYSRSVVREDDQELFVPDLPCPPSGMILNHLLMVNFCGNPLGLLIRRSALEAVGNFDDTLSCAEDYDMWLRLASRFPFSFVPGVVAVWRLSPHGRYASGIVDGSRARTMRTIIERALAPLPDNAAFRAIKRRARLAWGIGLAAQYPVYRVEDIRPLILGTLCECPSLAGSPQGRRAVAERVCEFAVASPDPVATARSFCEDLRKAAGDHGLRHRLQTRRMLALIWAELAFGFPKSSGATRRAAGCALIRSGLLDPSQALHKLYASFLRRVRKGATLLNAGSPSS